MHTLSRRSFLKSSGAATLGLFVPRARRSRTQADVVIVGAGIAGLAAAYELQKSGINSFLVIDARSQVGGRILNQTVAGATVEGGGEWIGPTHTAMLGLIQELGLSTFKTYDQGRELFAVGTRTVDGGGAAETEFNQVKSVINAMAQDIPLDTPWLAANAAVLDSFSLDAWLRGQGVGRDVRILFDKVTWSLVGALASDISFLYFLFYVHSSGDLDERLNITGGAQESRIVGGSQLIPFKLAERLGNRIVTNSPVRQIIDTGNKVQVFCDSFEIEAKRVIVAMMPADAGRIQFMPSMPPRRAGLMKYWPAAKVFKANVAYASPFWRGQGLSGEVTSVDAIYSVFDNSPPNGASGILEIFAQSGALPVRKRDRQVQILATLSDYFGAPALRPIGYTEKDWADEKWISGCVSPLGPGFLTLFGPALREPVGRIYWAGSETADVWNGKMDGAVRSGQAAATEAMTGL